MLFGVPIAYARGDQKIPRLHNYDCAKHERIGNIHVNIRLKRRVTKCRSRILLLCPPVCRIE